MKIVILHLSDIHIKNESDPILDRHSLISRSLYSHINENSHLFIIVSGDIAYSGKKKEYNIASDFFKQIKSNIINECKINVDFIICPGNHDCDFPSNQIRDIVLDSMKKNECSGISPEIIDTCTSHQKEYFSFKKELENNSALVEEDKLWTTYKFIINNETIVFESINLSWASGLQEQQGRLLFPFSLYTDKSKLDADIRISILHHPLNWLNQSSYREFRNNLRPMSNFVFTGHEHETNAVNHDDIESGKTIIIEGGVLQDYSIEHSEFSIIELGDTNSYYSYSLNKNNRYEVKDKKELSPLNPNLKSRINLSVDFKSKIDDCGAYFKHSNTTNLKLSDIFVYPNIRKVSASSKKNNSIPSTQLISINSFKKGIILSGSDNIGCTSLVYCLMSEYIQLGYIPVLLNGIKIKQKNEHNLNIQINKALKEQYEDENYNIIFEQEEKKKKILIIDDFDEIKIKSESSINDVLTYLMSKFENIILTVDSMFEVNEITSLEGKSTTRLFDHYKIEPFGYKKRTELINKWYSVGQQDHESESEIIGKCNIAEKLMDTVMDKSLIEPNPIFLLTFLQSIESGQSTQLSDSALGHYYKFLLTESFLDIGVGAESLGQELDYAMHLARFFNENDTFTITDEEFKQFNTYFSNTWQETCFNKKENTLIKAKVLIKNGNDYEFRYLYNYYYLLGLYLSQNILNEGIHSEISYYIEHLYVKKHANTILFLAHHSSSDNILLMMKNSADELFKDNIVADFNGGCSVANELIKDAPKLQFNNKSPQKNRIELSEKRDLVEYEKPKNQLEDKIQDSKNLNLAAKITMLFKTIDILSQIIKSNPTKFERIKKVEILKTIFSAPMRALQDFYNTLEQHPNYMIEVINDDISKKSNRITDQERDIIARLTISTLIQIISSGFVIKTAQIINSDVLRPDISTAIDGNSNLAFELIELAISLDNHKPLDKRKVKDIYQKCKPNHVAAKILDSLIMNRLHMYKTTEKDMQWLQSELKYDLIKQHNIGYNKTNKANRITNSTAA